MRFALVLVLAFVPATTFKAQEAASSAIDAQAARQIQAGDFQAAAVTAKAGLKSLPSDVQLWNVLGISETELNHPAAAREAFAAGLKIAPDALSLNENAGLLYYKQLDFKRAESYLAKAVKLRSKNPGVAFSLATCQIRQGRRAQGLAALRELEPALGTYAEYWDERGWAELPTDKEAADNSFAHALAADPNDLRALNGAASSAEAYGLDEKAINFLIRAKQAHPEDVQTLLHFASVCLRRDLTLDALHAAEAAYKIEPSNNVALYLLARSEIGRQHWQKAYDLFTLFAQRVPTYAPVYYALGWLDIKLNLPTEAKANLERSIALDPTYNDPRAELAELDIEADHLDDARTQLQIVLAKSPHHAKANLAMGELMLRQGNLPEARKFFETAIESDPTSGPAHYKLSTVLFRMNLPDDGQRERELGAKLNADAERSSKVVFQLATPSGAILDPVH